MSQINAPIHSYKTSQIYYQRPKIWQKRIGNFFGNFFLGPVTRYVDSDTNLRSSFFNKIYSKVIIPWHILSFNNLFFQSLENNLFCLFDCLFVCLENLAVQPNSENLAVQPNHEKPGGPNFPTNKKIFLSSFEYNFLNKHVEHLDQQMGAGHYLLGNKDVVYTTIVYDEE